MKNPEYVKFINNWFYGNELKIGKIYKWFDLINGNNESNLSLNSDFFNRWTNEFEVSTKEAYDAQNTFTVKKGDYLYCHTSLIMKGNSKVEAFAGKYYKSELNNCFTNESENEYHRVSGNPERWFRKATKEEFDTQNQPKFEVGKWYKYNGHIGKYIGHIDDIFKVSEYIWDKKHYASSSNWGYVNSDSEKILLEDLSEIQQYLPEGHPDLIKTKSMKINEFKENDYIVVLQKPNGNQSYLKINYIFKQYRNSKDLYATKDVTGSGTTCSDVTFNEKDTWRYATSEEIDMYDFSNEPVCIEDANKISFLVARLEDYVLSLQNE